MLIRLLILVVELFVVLLIVRALLSWFPVRPGTTLARFVGLLARVTDPVLAPLRRVIPPVRAGGMAIDLTLFIVVLAAEMIVLPLLHRL